MDAPIKTVIIGLGHIARHHITALQANLAYNLVGVCDINPALEKSFSLPCPFFTNSDTCIKECTPDVVIIATPNDTHFSLTKQVLEEGVCVILEKPSAQNMRDVEELDRIARERNLLLYHAFHAALAKEVLWLKEQFQTTEFKEGLGPMTGFVSHFYDPYITDGVLEPGARGLDNCWIDSGVNALSVLSEFLDLNDFVLQAAGVTRHSTLSCNIVQAMAHFSFAFGGMGIIDTNWTLGRNHKSTHFYFGQTGKSLCLNHSDQTVTKTDFDGTTETLFDASGEGERLTNHYHGVFADFEKRYRSSSGNGEHALDIHRILFNVLD